jgi:hypothetical protein
MADEKFTIKLFTSATGYISWKAKITTYLKSKKLDKALLDPPAEEAAKAKTQHTETDNTAKAIILNSLIEKEVIRVMNEDTTKRMLALLYQFHASRSAALSMALVKHRYIKMHEGRDINKHLGEYEQIVTEIQTLGGAISEEQLAWEALLSFPLS